MSACAICKLRLPSSDPDIARHVSTVADDASVGINMHHARQRQLRETRNRSASISNSGASLEKEAKSVSLSTFCIGMQ